MTKRKALGKGLSALIPGANNLEYAGDKFFQCPIEAIEPNPYQPREDFSDSELEAMVASVREKGIITPLLVSRIESGYCLIAGERRWRAAQKAGLERVPVVVKEVTPTESLELALIENLHRKDLNPIEEAAAYSKLLEQSGETQESLARRLGKDRSSIANTIRLLKLPAFIQKDIIDGRLSMGHARVLAGIADITRQKTLREAVIKKNLSVRQLETLAKVKGRKKTSKNIDTELAYYFQAVADKLKQSLGTNVQIMKSGKKGRIVLYFYSDEELDRLIELLG
ncbi:MAG TPA: ParB/RepB/Spo0J family partition protein [Desulfobacteraceae bacterium]|nr:ParB/RepB/Spo0J family partition protein [Desulfobacteraceae bacterium]HPQ28687.1 ParB/RepB/Spo0J family partition protein [Desulfobacteraceae bacterium]